ncbi:MAG: hypothetical protein ACKO1Z_00015 [Actinomycetota bacterium]
MCAGCMAIAMASLMGPNTAPAAPAPTLISAPKADLKKEAALRIKANFRESRLVIKSQATDTKAI